jgi:Ni2+-binding GTPase involved in maturation of urease and hydrogenase
VTTVTVLYVDVDAFRKQNVTRLPMWDEWQRGDPMLNVGTCEVESGDVFHIAEQAYYACQNLEDNHMVHHALGTANRSMSVGDVVVLEADGIALCCQRSGFRMLATDEYIDITKYL